MKSLHSTWSLEDYRKKLSLCHTPKLFNPVFLQPDGLKLWYFKLRPFDLTETDKETTRFKDEKENQLRLVERKKDLKIRK